MKLNDWNDHEVERAEKTWGHKVHPYSEEMFNFAIEGMNSWLDLGCGFGRFLEYLLTKVDEPDYTGYDSSQDMIDRSGERFPVYRSRTFLHNITAPINCSPDSIICSAILIHITMKDQLAALKRIKEKNPKKLSFDINSPSEKFLKGCQNHYERIITGKGWSSKFRMTWQSHYEMTKTVNKLFPNYNVKTGFYELAQERQKVIYMLQR